MITPGVEVDGHYRQVDVYRYRRKGKRAVDKATTEEPAACVIPADKKRQFDAALNYDHLTSNEPPKEGAKEAPKEQ